MQFSSQIDIKRPVFLCIPCGQVLGHGECCVEGHMCDQCEYILKLEKYIELLKRDRNTG